jgi:hypothetical protein
MPNTHPSFWQKKSTEELAAEAAQGWLNYPPNKMSLPHYNKKADVDGDGLVDATEFQELFDLDGDGKISQLEKVSSQSVSSTISHLQQSDKRLLPPLATQEKAAKLFAMVDKDGDGQLTQEEMKQVRVAPGLNCFPRWSPTKL